ncbi:MAG: DUF302 domain-containing protein [Thermodesulfobacteriota bacterium]
MKKDQVYATESAKSTKEFVKALGAVAKKNGFVLHNETTMDMAHSFGKHGAEVAEGFDLHMIQICKPEKAAKSLSANPERAILMPKFVMTFTKNGKTQIRFLTFSADNIRAVVDDEAFPASLAETYKKIIEMIEEAK